MGGVEKLKELLQPCVISTQRRANVSLRNDHDGSYTASFFASSEEDEEDIEELEVDFVEKQALEEVDDDRIPTEEEFSDKNEKKNKENVSEEISDLSIQVERHASDANMKRSEESELCRSNEHKHITNMEAGNPFQGDEDWDTELMDTDPAEWEMPLSSLQWMGKPKRCHHEDDDEQALVDDVLGAWDPT